MNWEKLKPKHYYTEPVEHIYSMSVFDTKEYDMLYENQNNLDHKCWQDFDSKYKIGFEFKEDFTKLELNKEVICLWFFKERSDQTLAHVQVAEKQLGYHPNTFLITKSKDIKFVETKRKYIRNPFVQLDMSEKQYDDIVSRFQK